MLKYAISVFTISLTLSLCYGDFKEDLESCTMSDELEDKCSTVCYPTIKPLLQYVGECYQKNGIISQLEETIREQKVEINQYVAEIDRLKIKNKEDNNSTDSLNQLNQALDNNKAIINQLHAELNFSNKLNASEEAVTKLNEKILEQRKKYIELFKTANERALKLRSCCNQEEDSEESLGLPTSCMDIPNAQGVKRIKVPGAKSFEVLCDSEILGHGWTLILHNQGGENFDRNWTEYKNGFGEVSFFWGLEALYLMTRSQPHELFIAAGFEDNSTISNHFDNFIIGGESDGYRLKSVGKPSNDGLLFIKAQVNSKFSTFDRNNVGTETNLAVKNKGGWWFSEDSDLCLTYSQPKNEWYVMMVRAKTGEN